jgi:hypothetical protein
MNKLFLLLAVLFLGTNAEAGEPQKSFWFCKAIGNMGNHSILFISRTWKDDLPNNYSGREKEFLNYINQITNKQFRPSFQATCRGYFIKNNAYKHRTLSIGTAKHHEVKIMEFDWRWKPNV